MDFKVTSRLTNKIAQRGFALSEFVIGAAIGVLVLGTTCVLWAFASKSCAGVLNYVDMANSSKIALDRISQQIRNCTNIVSCTSNTLSLKDPDGASVSYTYRATSRTLVETISSSNSTKAKILLTECYACNFANWRSFSTNATTTPGNLVSMDWKCSRKLTGSQTNTEHQVSATILARNQ